MDVCTALAGGHWTEKLPDPVAPPAEPKRRAPCLCIIHRRVLVRNGYGAPSPPLSCHEIATTGVRMVTVRWLELQGAQRRSCTSAVLFLPGALEIQVSLPVSLSTGGRFSRLGHV